MVVFNKETFFQGSPGDADLVELHVTPSKQWAATKFLGFTNTKTTRFKTHQGMQTLLSFTSGSVLQALLRGQHTVP
jgi:hypothetical protein